MWVNKVSKSCVMIAPNNIVPLLFLDSHRCYMMASVVGAIQKLGIKDQPIPGGCTSLCYLVNIGVNKPFENWIYEQWESWIVLEGILHRTTSPPSGADTCKWFVVAFQNLPMQIVKNA
jgi:hypothetical protein